MVKTFSDSVSMVGLEEKETSRSMILSFLPIMVNGQGDLVNVKKMKSSGFCAIVQQFVKVNIRVSFCVLLTQILLW